MPSAAGPARAVGSLRGSPWWVGFQETGGRYQLVFGAPDGRLVTDRGDGLIPATAGLVAVALAYFAEALLPPPPDAAATHADLAHLVRWLGAQATDPAAARIAKDASDAIDDGLGGDTVALRVAAMLPDARTDPISVLGERLGRVAAAPASRAPGY